MLHLQAARKLLTEGEPIRAVARHLVAAGGTLEPWAVAALREAAAEAVALSAEPEAREFLHTARQGTDSPAVAAELTDLDWWIRPAAAVGALTELARTDGLPSPATAVLVRRLAWHGRIEEASELLAARPDPGIDGAVTDAWLSRLYPGAFGARTGAPALDEVAATHPWLRADADPGAVLQGLALHRGALEPLQMSLLALDGAGTLDTEAGWFADLLAAARRSSSRVAEALLIAARARVELRRGELRTAEESAETALCLLTPASWGVLIGMPLATVLESLTEQGRHAEVPDRLRATLPQAISRTPYGLIYLRARGQHFLATGRSRAALGEFLAAGEIQRSWGADHPGLSPWMLDAARAHLALGEPAAARELAGRQLRGPGGDRPRIRAGALRILAGTVGPGRRPESLREAITLAERSGDRLELARCLAELGRAFTEAGQPEYAYAPLQRAWRIATDSGAGLLLAELAAGGLGGPPVDPAEARGLAQLSDAERRVAELAAQGYKNREIARRLFLTASTVEQHLTRIYRKLGVRRRSALAAIPGLVPAADVPRPGRPRPLCARPGMV
ncbi:helix-turn-helix transcriptional regulator [Actinoplanes couchii]|uniref:helix-turn-helix transcriptional regulator n=1 Tax=Actinoplanes couchii TaxID=403638 RepID=UPI001EF383BB|nr:LuxR family transcriptional regulator [Actinoplanes couchii]MDR6319727.1 DNA-binding CsgD family transcriptional regulator [Actinoplanes couchii]